MIMEEVQFSFKPYGGITAHKTRRKTNINNHLGGLIMEGRKIKLLLLFVVVLLFGSAVVAFGDWDPCDPYKMHFPQLPDPCGWDIAFCWAGPTELRLELADDWLCTKTGPVSDIHFWISWEGDLVGTIESVMVCIYSNDPCGPSGWSEPNVLLWSRYFPDGNGLYTVRPYGSGQQGWYDPNTGMWNKPDHYNYYQINITDINDPFIQEEGKIYWLGIHIKAVPFPECRVGWKTAVQPHFMDDAVWRVLSTEMWTPLHDPNTYESLDLSFVITGGEEPNYAKPLEPHTKWSQPPIEIDPNSVVPTYCGWDEQSRNGLPKNKWKIVADDYRCIGSMPVTSIHWWGSFFGWEWPEHQGQLPPVLPANWWIGFWSNVPAGAEPNYLPYSYPNKLLHSITIPAARVDFNEVGYDEYVSRPNDICYQYHVDLNSAEVFWQDDFNGVTDANTYWISIVAEYNVVSVYEYQWGWKTRPWSWMDDAVTFILSFKPGPNFVIPDPCQVTRLIDQWGESVDVSFELDTDPNYIKWEQLYTGIRNWPHYEDVNSTYNFYKPEKERLVADDWRCVRRTPVTAVVWWGSYIDYIYEACQGPMSRPVPPDKFRLKIWTDVPVDGKADVLFLTDTTLSMGGYINDLKDALSGIFAAIGEFMPGLDIEYGVADYKDYGDGGNYQAYGVNLIQPFTSNTNAVQAAINGLSAGGGNDHPESQLTGMVSTANNWLTPAGDLGFNGRADAQKILIWAGDAHGHIAGDEPGSSGHPPAGYYPSLSATINALTAQGIKVFALNKEDCANGLNYPYDGLFNQTPPQQQADEITSATGGTLFCDVDSGGPSIENAVVASIKSGVGHSHPGEVIWQYDANEYDEVLVGYDKHPEDVPPYRTEPVFRYSVRLPDANWFHQPAYNEVFWLSVQAIYDINMPDYEWGWTNHKHMFNDDAVSGYYDDANEVWVWDEELYDQTGASEDMSFMLFTDPALCSTCANYNCDARVNFVDFADFADDWRWVGPAGGYNNSDLDCNGVVDFKDVGIFCLQWLTYCP